MQSRRCNGFIPRRTLMHPHPQPHLSAHWAGEGSDRARLRFRLVAAVKARKETARHQPAPGLVHRPALQAQQQVVGIHTGSAGRKTKPKLYGNEIFKILMINLLASVMYNVSNYNLLKPKFN